MAGNLDIEKINQMLKEAEKSLSKVPQLKQLKKATGLQIVWMLMAAFAMTLFMIYIFSGLRALGTCIGVVYPAWCSLKAIKSSDKDDDTFWLAYWVIYGIFSAFESITDILLFWVPFYELLKIVFYIYLFSPQLKGALTLYVFHFISSHSISLIDLIAIEWVLCCEQILRRIGTVGGEIDEV